jgi:hypothetical protein
MRPDGCVHKWQIDSKNVGTCSVCGEVRQFPVEKGGQPVVLKAGHLGNRPDRKKGSDVRVNIRARSKFYEDNRDAIIADFGSIGKTRTRHKWSIPKGTLNRLIDRWLTPEQKASIAPSPYITRVASSPGAKSPNGRLPHFPEFSGTWQPEVQVRWLDVYEKLATKQGGKS